MTPERFQQILEMNLVGRIINLQDVSDHDGYEILGRIVEIKLEGNDLRFKTTETRRRWWNEEFEPYDQSDFLDSIEHVQDLTITDGRISFYPWSSYDYVHILLSQP